MTRALIFALLLSTLAFSDETLNNGQPRPHIKIFTCKNLNDLKEVEKSEKEINDFLADPTVVYHNHAQSSVRRAGFTLGLTYFKRDFAVLTEEEKKSLPPPTKIKYFIKKLPADADGVDAELLALETELNNWLRDSGVELLFQAVSQDSAAGFVVTFIYREP